jgi:galactokinase
MSSAGERIETRAPGRVNLIGDHTDYTGGLALPLAIDRQIVVRGVDRDEPMITLTSDQDPTPATIPLPAAAVAATEPPWARRVAAIAAELGRERGFEGSVESTVPIGAGLSSSGALGVALALALGDSARQSRLDVALLCQRAQQAATGVPAGVLDEMASLYGMDGHALLLDCHDLTVEPVRLPEDAQVVVKYVSHRTVVGSPYSDRVAACHTAEEAIGPLRLARTQDLSSLTDPVLLARARHVVTENERVRECVEALKGEDLVTVGRLMTASHISLRDDYEVSTPDLDAAVEALISTPGVYGARLTGAGFGGCVIGMAAPGAVKDAWVMRAVDGAEVVEGRSNYYRDP